MVAKNIYASSQHKIYDEWMVNAAFVAYVLLWISSVWLAGGYDKPLKPLRVFRPLIIGSAIILIAYSLLPESLRFSRALLLIGAAVACVVFFLSRVVSNLITTGNTGLLKNVNKRMAVIGEEDEMVRVKNILSQTNQSFSEVIHVSPKSYKAEEKKIQLDEIVRVHRIEQVVFCARDISSADIISAMSSLDDKNIEFKIAPPESLYIIGSGSIETSGDAFMLDVNSVSLTKNKRIKRLLDVVASLLMIVFIPIMLFIVRNQIGFIRNVLQVLIGKKTWVGYAETGTKASGLPRLQSAVLHPADIHPASTLSAENILKLNLLYAKDYRLLNDTSIIWRSMRSLGR